MPVSSSLSRPLFAALLLSASLGATDARAAAPTFLEDEAEAATNVSFALPSPGAQKLSLVFDWQNERNFYALEADAKGATFSLVQNGQKRALASSPVSWAAKNSVVLQRRPWLMQLIVNDRIVLRAFDTTWREGKIGTLATTWNPLDVRVQPLETVRFDDDFTRAGQEGDASWKGESGKWILSASSESISAKNATMSSNPFAYEVQASSTPSLVTGGRRFWDAYDARVSVRPESRGEIGLAAYVKDAKNYLAFRWSATEGAKSRTLVRVENGRETVLASAGGAWLPRQWYRLGMRVSPGYVEAIVDGVPILRAKNEFLGQGGVGLWAKNTHAAFDDVQVRSYDFLRADFARNGAWTRSGGEWTLGGGLAKPTGPADNILTTGAPDWNGYRALVSLPSSTKDATGFVVGWRDAKNHTRFEMTATRAKITRVQNGKTTSLFDAPLIATKASSTTRLSVSADNGVLSVTRGEQIIAQAGGEGLTTGRFGLLSRGPRAGGFSDAVIFFAPPAERPKIAPKMQDDAYMVGWASPSGEWPPTPGPGGLEFWNTGSYFGDAQIEFPWRASWRGRFEVALRAERGKFDSGYVLRGVASDDKLSINWTLLRGEKELAKATVKVADLAGAETSDGAKLRVVLSGNGVLFGSTNAPILSYLDSKPPTGSSFAVRSSGFRVRADRLSAISSNRDDYTFTEAPTDFYAPSGSWSVFSRWPCYGDWSFFGGTGRNPVLWTKRQYSGDVVAEFYAHPQMDLPKEPGYSHPADLNLTIAGDGLNPASGYSFVVAGHDNTRTQILRGTKVVAERTDEPARFQNTINHDMRWHRRWFYIRGEAKRAQKDGKSGVMVSLTLDEDRLLEWFDEDPLPSFEKGGRVAMWTVDNTLMIARAKIEAEHMGARSLPAALIEANRPAATTSANAKLAPVPVVEAGVATAVVDRDGDNWRVVNPATGGVFGVDLTSQPLEATPATKLGFDAQIPAGTKIDLYAFVDEQWHTIEVTGGQKPDALAPSLGRATSSNGAGGLTRYGFDIGAALAKEFPGASKWKVEKLRLGALHGDQYRWVGFDGNATGASYRVGKLEWK